MGAALMVTGILTSKSSLNALVVIGVFVEVVFLLALGSAISTHEPRLNTEDASR